MKRLSIAAIMLAVPLAACVQQATTAWTPIPRPAPDDPTPQGIAYVCDGRKEVTVVYAKNRASVTFDGKTWRMEYQPTDAGLPLHRRGQRMDRPRRSRRPARKRRQRAADGLQLPADQAHHLRRYFSQNLMA